MWAVVVASVLGIIGTIVAAVTGQLLSRKPERSKLFYEARLNVYVQYRLLCEDLWNCLMQPIPPPDELVHALREARYRIDLVGDGEVVIAAWRLEQALKNARADDRLEKMPAEKERDATLAGQQYEDAIRKSIGIKPLRWDALEASDVGE